MQPESRKRKGWWWERLRQSASREPLARAWRRSVPLSIRVRWLREEVRPPWRASILNPTTRSAPPQSRRPRQSRAPRKDLCRSRPSARPAQRQRLRTKPRALRGELRSPRRQSRWTAKTRWHRFAPAEALPRCSRFGRLPFSMRAREQREPEPRAASFSDSTRSAGQEPKLACFPEALPTTDWTTPRRQAGPRSSARHPLPRSA